jgi:hypothetical protein
MANMRDPILKPIPILSLRPTQMTVGLREVKEKRKRWREHKSEKKRAELLGMIRSAASPGNCAASAALQRTSPRSANFYGLRRKISRKSVEENFDKAMEKALGFAGGQDAIYLPGWCGPLD